MATGVTAESVLDSIIQGHLECPICHSRYQEPKMLDCAHSFCLRCLQELKKTQNQDTKIACPLCQRETIIPQGGLEKFNTNYVLTSLVEEVNKQEQLLSGLQVSKVICQACDEENEVISRCMDCEHYLCQECQKAHQRWAVLRTHTVRPLAELQGESTPKTEPKMDASKCEAHQNNELCFYCNTCEQLICKQCAASSHKDPTHTYVELATAVDIRFRDARNRISEAYRRDSYKVSGSWKALRNRLRIMLEETNLQVCQTAEEKIKQIREEENQLKQMAQMMYRKRDKKLAEMVAAEQTMGMFHREMTDAQRLELLKIRQDLLHDYRDVVEEQTKDMSRSLSFISFKENQSEVKLGALLQEEKWGLLKTAMVTGYFVAAFSNGDLVVTDTNNATKLSPGCMILNERNMKKHTALAANKDDQLIVLCESDVWILDKEYHILHQFMPGKQACIKGKPTCLAVDDSNQIAVGYKDKEQISLHNPDGSLIRTLQAPMIDKYMTISNNQIIYTNSTSKKLMCVDCEGNNEFTVDVHHSPYGVCCAKAGDIYITVCAGKESRYEQNRIQHYSPKGKIIESVSREGNDSQSDITYTPDGKLVVTGNTSTQMYHRV